MPKLNISEFGQTVRVNMLEDVSTATTLNFILEPQLGEKLEKSASDGVVVGSSNITVDDESYLANQYLEYRIKAGDLAYQGQWRIKGEAVFPEVTGVNVQQIADPNFDIQNTTSDGTGSDWLWANGEWVIAGNVLNSSVFGKLVKTRLIYEVHTNLRVKWTATNALGAMFLGTVNFPLEAGSHDEVIVVPETPGDLTIATGASAPLITNFEITPLPSAEKIVSDYKRIEVLA